MVIQGDSKEKLQELEAESHHSCVTDPPYELGMLNRAWDSSGIAFDVEFWQEVKRVLKPGAHLVAFGGDRTHHRMIVAIEEAGFEIRSTLIWIMAGGFPKSHDVSKAIDKLKKEDREVVGTKQIGDSSRSEGKDWNKQSGFSNGEVNVTAPSSKEAKKWEGWGTGLKPGYEPICLARKPLSEDTIAENVLKHSTGAINIDSCRIGTNEDVSCTGSGFSEGKFMGNQGRGESTMDGENWEMSSEGRWPSNLLLGENAGELLDKQSGTLHSRGNVNQSTSGGGSGNTVNPGPKHKSDHHKRELLQKDGGASRFFYCPKAHQGERNIGCENNDHPTVKPVELMAYLVRLTTPPGGKVIDPFGGSGTTGIASVLEQKKFTLIEKEENHASLAEKRIEYTRENVVEVRKQIFEDPSNKLTEESEVTHDFW